MQVIRQYYANDYYETREQVDLESCVANRLQEMSDQKKNHLIAGLVAALVEKDVIDVTSLGQMFNGEVWEKAD